jgi:hypothetical protein
MEQYFASKAAQLEHQHMAERARTSFQRSKPDGRGRLRGAALVERLRTLVFGRGEAPPLPTATAAPGRKPQSIGAAD